MDRQDLYREAKNFYSRPSPGDFQSNYLRDLFFSVPNFKKVDEYSPVISALENEKFLIYVTEKVVERGDLITFSVGKDVLDGEGNVIGMTKSRREYLVNNSFLTNPFQLTRTGLSIVATALGIDYLRQSKTSGTDHISDMQEHLYFNYTFGDFEIISNIPQADGLGFFPKKIPQYEEKRHKYNFNDDDDNLFCPFTALYKQDKNQVLPKIFSKDDFYEIYERCGFNISDDFHLSQDKLLQLYRSFAKAYNLNIRIKLFYFKKLEKDIKPETHDYAHYNNSKVELILKNDDSRESYNNPTRFYVARMRGHVFNLQGGTETKQLNYLNYLNITNCLYNSLELKERDIKKLSRKMAIEFNEYKKNKMNNPSLLLKGEFNLDEYCEEPKKRTNKSALTSPGQDKQGVSTAPTVDDMQFVFVYDLETTNDENGKFTIYSYYNSCYRVPKWYEDTYGKIKDDFHFCYKSNIVHNVTLYGEKVAIINSPITHMFNEILNNVPDGAQVVLYAHNGSNFDNTIARELMMSTLGFSDIKEVCTGQNQGILLSLECKYRYYRNKLTTNRYTDNVKESSMMSDFRQPYTESTEPVSKLDTRNISVSLRDSKKIINYPVSALPNTFGFKEYKLPYDYAYYQNFMDKVEKKEISTYKIKTGLYQYYDDEFTFEKVEKLMRDDFDKDFIKEYFPLLDGSYIKNLDNGELKNDIVNYVEYLKNKKSYYDTIEYCKLYNKYDTKVVITAMKKFQEHINALESKDSMVRLVFNHGLETFKTKQNLIDEAKKGNSFALKIISTIADIKKSDESFVKGSGEIQVHKYRSLASIVFDMCKNYGVYDNIYKLKGDLKLFIQKSVVGGRVMANYNKINKIKNYDEVISYIGKESNPEDNKKILDLVMDDAILDFDGVSLYPSAISICNMPAGKPILYNHEDKTIKEALTELITSNKRFFICCDIETTKDLRYPILSEMIIKDNAQSRNFRNGKFEQLVIGDQTLRDVIRYQKAKVTNIYTVVLFPETCNQFAKLIKCLFDLRLTLKAIGLPCQETVKTLMSSSYGRTILKNSEYKTKYFCYATNKDKQRFNNVLSKNFHLIKPEINCYGLFKKISMRDNKKPEGYPHVGSAILEMSKSLMHKAFNLLDDRVFYTDTDSIHMLAKDLPKVSSLIGKNMCQFHSDFDPSRRNDPVFPIDKNIGTFAIHSIFVMKKCYYDELFCIDKNGKYCIREHKRVKGVPSGFMNKEKYIGLVNGNTYECNLTDYHNMITKKDKNGKLLKMSDFKRSIKMT